MPDLEVLLAVVTLVLMYDITHLVAGQARGQRLVGEYDALLALLFAVDDRVKIFLIVGLLHELGEIKLLKTDTVLQLKRRVASKQSFDLS